MGEDTTENRSSDTVKMLNYGFNTFKINIIKKRGESLGKVRVEKGKQDFSNIVLLNDATEILKNTDPVIEYKFNLKVDKIKAPLKIGDIVGSAEIIDNDGNIVDEVDVTIDKEIKKANILDYMLKNLRTIGAGKSLLKQN